MNDPFEYQYRLAHLITIDLTNHNNRFFVRNPVPGNAQDIPQSANNFAIASAGSIGRISLTFDCRKRKIASSGASVASQISASPCHGVP